MATPNRIYLAKTAVLATDWAHCVTSWLPALSSSQALLEWTSSVNCPRVAS